MNSPCGTRLFLYSSESKSVGGLAILRPGIRERNELKRSTEFILKRKTHEESAFGERRGISQIPLTIPAQHKLSPGRCLRKTPDDREAMEI